MAIKEGNQTDVETDNMPLSADVNTRLGVTTSQFVLIDDKDLTRDEMKDDLYKAVTTGDTVKVGELTGRGPDVKRPEPSGATTIEGEAEHNREHQSFEDAERKRRDEQNARIAAGNAAAENPDDKPANGLPGADDGATGSRSTLTSETEMDIVAAALRGDTTAIARLKLAQKAREQNEHIDVDGDGHIYGTRGGRFQSVLFHRDRFGGYVATDGAGYDDDFGGHYDSFGYRSKSGNYRNRSGESYNAATNEFKEKNGKTMEVPEAVKQMAAEDRTAGATFLSMAEAAQQRINNGANGNPDASAGLDLQRKVSTTEASKGEGSGQKTTATTTGVQAREVATIGTAMQQDDKKKGKPVKKDYQYLPEAERMQWKLHQEFGVHAKEVMADHKKLMDYIQSHRSPTATAAQTTAPAANGTNGSATPPDGQALPSEFTAVSADVVAKKLNAQPLVHHAEGEEGPGGAKTSSGAKVDTASSTTWYADKDGGYWDEFGGYYDKDGAYWDTDGTYYSADGKFTIDPKGGTHWTDGSYTDTHGHTVDKDGNYVDFDGTKVKPPEGVDFKKQMVEADQKGERWTPPERAAPLVAADTRLPSTLLENLPFTFKPSLSLPPLTLQPPTLPGVTPISAGVDLKLTPPPLIADIKPKASPVIVTDTKQDANFKVDTSRFSPCTVQTTPDPKAVVAAAAVTPASSWSFSSLFSGVHDWMMGSDKTTTVKDTKFLDTATSNACTTSPLALNSGTITPLLSATETKSVVTPKPGL